MSIDFNDLKVFYYTLRFSFNMSARKLTYIKKKPSSEIQHRVQSELINAFCAFNEKAYSD